MLQLRKNRKGRFTVLSLLGNGGQVTSVIFPEGAKAEGWFRVKKILEETLIRSLLPHQGRLLFHPGFWDCGSWDVCAAVIGEDQNLSRDALMQKVSFKDNAIDASLLRRMVRRSF